MSPILGLYSNLPPWIIEFIVLGSMIIFTAVFSPASTPFQVKSLASILCLDITLQVFSPQTRMKILNIKIPGEYYHQCILAGDLRVKTLVLSISQHAALIWFCSWLFGSNIQAVAFWMPIYTLIATMVITVVVKIIGHLHYLHSRLQLELANYFSRSTTTKRVPEIINEDPEDLGDFDKAADLLHPGQVSIVESTVQNLSEFSSMTDSSYLRRPTNEGIVEHSGYLPLN